MRLQNLYVRIPQHVSSNVDGCFCGAAFGASRFLALGQRRKPELQVIPHRPEFEGEPGSDAPLDDLVAAARKLSLTFKESTAALDVVKGFAALSGEHRDAARQLNLQATGAPQLWLRLEKHGLAEHPRLHDRSEMIQIRRLHEMMRAWVISD